MVYIKVPVDEKYEEELSKLDEEFQDVKASMSYIRKQGKDTSIAEVLCIDFTPKLRMAKATYDPKDLQALKDLIASIRAELKEAEEGSLFNQAVEMIKDGYEFLRQGNFAKAGENYSSVVALYKDIPHEHKRVIYQACLDLKKKIEAAIKESGEESD